MSGSDDLKLPDELRHALQEHLSDLRRGFERRGWNGRVGWGRTPALLVIDLARRWTDPRHSQGSDLESVVENTYKVLAAARGADIPIFFTTMAFGPDDPQGPVDAKNPGRRADALLGSEPTELDPRLGRRPNEKLIVKKYASGFKGTDLQEMLAGLGVDTLIVTGCSTSHCVYDTCRDAVAGFRLIVPEGAVGERSELFHLVNLLDIDLGLADVLPVEEVVGHLDGIAAARRAASRT